MSQRRQRRDPFPGLILQHLLQQVKAIRIKPSFHDMIQILLVPLRKRLQVVRKFCHPRPHLLTWRPQNLEDLEQLTDLLHSWHTVGADRRLTPFSSSHAKQSHDIRRCRTHRLEAEEADTTACVPPAQQRKRCCPGDRRKRQHRHK